MLRDEHGSVSLAAHSALKNCLHAEEAEAKALLLGLKLATSEGHAKIILETDCANAVVALRSKDTDRSSLCFVYNEAKSLLINFQDFLILSASRDCNRVADGLAKLAYSDGDRVLRNELPDSIRVLVTNDLPIDSSV